MTIDAEQVAATGGDSQAAAPGASSAVPETVDSGTGGPAVPASTTESPKSSLDAVKAVMDRDRAAAADKAKPAAEQQAPEAEQQAEPKAGDDKAGEATDPDEDPKTWSPRAQARIRELNAEYRKAERQVQALQPDAQAMQQLRGWVQANGLDMQSAVAGLEIMALVRTNPEEAWKRLEPIVKSIRGEMGEELPQDLADAVESGAITPEYAKETARLRAANTRTTRLTAEQQQRQAEYQAQQQATEMVGRIQGAIAAYEKDWQANDPDYARKHAWVQTEVMALIGSEGLPRNEQEAVAQVKRARENVEKRLKATIPNQRREVNSVVTSGSTAAAVGQPRSSLEAAKMALEGHKPRYEAA